ncbi:protein delta homolog 2 [Bufo bufo]|uniref:protein delta homolog 2 n=1 Tax=Bufo bufo TaxID=8384 RepID=UPI001ABE6949|nr:protein delta homolog 2 [Bufo bufo]
MLWRPPLLLSALYWVLFMLQTSVTADECTERCDLYHGHCDEDAVCRCDPGWDGPFCEDCVRMPGCVHGVCHQPWQCMCLSGWDGKFCDKDLHICERSSPCQNGAECVITPEGDYSCDCPESFHGKNCELKRGPCEAQGLPCQNGGTCLDDGGYAEVFTCRCLAGYVGRLCETDVDDCLMRPCANGATCVDGVNRFSCQCPPGFQGRFCTVNIDDCAGRPCHNGGRCYDRVGDYECYCPAGFTGTSCEILVPRPTWEYEAGTSARAPSEPSGRTVSSTRWSPGSTEKPGHFKISVKEVVTQREHGLSELQLITIAVLGVITVVVIILTVLLMMRHRSRGASCWCHQTSPETKTHYHQCQGMSQEHGKTTEL